MKKHQSAESVLENYLRNLGKRLRHIRESKNLTLEECEELGYSSWRHLAAIEQGKKNVTLKTLLSLSKLYKTNPSEILKDIL